MAVVLLAGGEVDAIGFARTVDICLASWGWSVVGHCVGWSSFRLDELPVAALARCIWASTCCIISSIRCIRSLLWWSLSSIA